MPAALRVLLVEDNEDDAQLTLHELRRGGYDLRWKIVDSREAMARALTKHDWDVVICDYSLPHFGAPEALKILRDGAKDIPFIIV